MALTESEAWELAEDIEGTEGWEEHEAILAPIDNHWWLVKATHNEGGVHEFRHVEEWRTIRAVCDPTGWGEHTCEVEGCLLWAEQECPGNTESEGTAAEECTAVCCDDHANPDGRCPYHAAAQDEIDGEGEDDENDEEAETALYA